MDNKLKTILFTTGLLFLAATLAIHLLAPGYTAHAGLEVSGRYNEQGLAPSDQPHKAYLPVILKPGLNVTRFATLLPGSALPNEQDCAAAVKSKAENKGMNAVYNQTLSSQSLGSDYFGWGDPRMNTEIAPRVTGNFTGTTDEILQWAACKWGNDEDIVRAQAARESWWQMTAKGDWSTDPDVCSPGHGLGVDGKPGQCPES